MVQRQGPIILYYHFTTIYLHHQTHHSYHQFFVLFCFLFVCFTKELSVVLLSLIHPSRVTGLPVLSKIFIKWVKSLSRVRLFATPWTVAYQAPPSMGFSRQECWSGLPLPSPGDLPNPGIEPGSPTLQADPLPSEPVIWAELSTNTLLSQGNALLIHGHTLKERF